MNTTLNVALIIYEKQTPPRRAIAFLHNSQLLLLLLAANSLPHEGIRAVAAGEGF